MWVMLYAQVAQADGADRRNILVDRQPAPPIAGHQGQTRDVIGLAKWEDAGIRDLLVQLGLPLDSPLSALAVELLPPVGEHTDPLGMQLGDVRILRTSPLVPIPARCATD
jgi:hypothetical protein